LQQNSFRFSTAAATKSWENDFVMFGYGGVQKICY